MKELFVLAKITKQEDGKVKLNFYYSSEPRDYKKISRCTREIQRLVKENHLDFRAIVGSTMDFNAEARVFCMDLTTRKSVCIEDVCEHLSNPNLLWDRLITDIDHEKEVCMVVEELARVLGGWGWKQSEGGKVFVQIEEGEPREVVEPPLEDGWSIVFPSF